MGIGSAVCRRKPVEGRVDDQGIGIQFEEPPSKAAAELAFSSSPVGTG
jgi:hypothetical protein